MGFKGLFGKQKKAQEEENLEGISSLNEWPSSGGLTDIGMSEEQNSVNGKQNGPKPSLAPEPLANNNPGNDEGAPPVEDKKGSPATLASLSNSGSEETQEEEVQEKERAGSEDEVDELLDIFKEEKVVDERLVSLVEELEDLDINDLMEECEEVAAQLGR